MANIGVTQPMYLLLSLIMIEIIPQFIDCLPQWSTDCQMSTSEKFISLKPLGIFWDINQDFIPLMLKTNQCIKQLREFISNKFNNNCIEYQFCCVCDSTQLNQSVINSLNGSGCDVIHIESNTETNVFIEFHKIVEQFVQNYGFDSIVVLISSNCHLSSTIRSVQHKDVSLLLIYGQNPNQSLIESAYESVAFDDIVVLNQRVILSINNLPKDKSRTTIRTSFLPFCRQFNCKFRFNQNSSAILEFKDINDAKRAELTLTELEFFGRELKVEFNPDIDHNNNPKDNEIQSDSGSTQSTSVSTPLSLNGQILAQNDDKCKSVIIGLFTKYNQNVYKLVRNLVKSWNHSSVDESMIVRVNRQKEFIERHGKASLIVTAIDRQSNDKLISVAKKMFVNRQNKLYWNRLQRSKKDLSESQTQNNSYQNCGNDCKSIITGLWTKYDENVMKTVKNLVKSWNIYSFDIRNIVFVERAKRYDGRDGKAGLIVYTDTAYNCKRLLGFASAKFNDSTKKFYWNPFKTFDSNKKLETNDKISEVFPTKSSGSYADITSKTQSHENTETSLEKKTSINNNYHRRSHSGGK